MTIATSIQTPAIKKTIAISPGMIPSIRIKPGALEKPIVRSNSPLIGFGLRLGKQLGAYKKGDICPDKPADEGGNETHNDALEAADTKAADARCQAGQNNYGHRLSQSAFISLNFFIEGNV